MKIAFICGGILNIPPKKFGAIEMIIWNYKIELEKLGHEVVIYNDRDLKKVAESINNSNYDFVHLNYSEYVGYFLKNIKRPFCTTCHSGYITNKKKWSIGYHSVFYDTMKCGGIISLSDFIKEQYQNNGYKGFIRTVRNGIDVGNFIVKDQGNNRAVCLGRIEPRKRQTWLAKIIREDVRLDFVGPIEDDNFEVKGSSKYAGYWVKPEVYQKLSDYSCLVLMSDGEAAPLVVPEALSAGLSIVVTKSASANLDKSLPYVSILPDTIKDREVISDTINNQIENNTVHRHEIVEYARNYFDMSRVVSDYVKVIEEFNKTNTINNFKIPLKSIPIYYVSKFALWIKRIIYKLKPINLEKAD